MCIVQNEVLQYTDDLANADILMNDKLSMLDWDDVKLKIAEAVDSDCTVFNHLLKIGDDQKEKLCESFSGLLVASLYIGSGGIDVDLLSKKIQEKARDIGIDCLKIDISGLFLALDCICEKAIQDHKDEEDFL